MKAAHGSVQILYALTAKPTTESTEQNMLVVIFAISLLPEPAAASCSHRVWSAFGNEEVSFHKRGNAILTDIAHHIAKGYSFSKSQDKVCVCVCGCSSMRVRQRGLLLIIGCFSMILDHEGYPEVSHLSEDVHRSLLIICCSKKEESCDSPALSYFLAFSFLLCHCFLFDLIRCLFLDQEK